MFHCGTCVCFGGRRRYSVILLSVSSLSGYAASTPLPSGALGLGEGLLVGMLLGMDLFVQEVASQLLPIFYLQLRSDTETAGITPRSRGRPHWCAKLRHSEQENVKPRVLFCCWSVCAVKGLLPSFQSPPEDCSPPCLLGGSCNWSTASSPWCCTCTQAWSRWTLATQHRHSSTQREEQGGLESGHLCPPTS